MHGHFMLILIIIEFDNIPIIDIVYLYSLNI